MPPATPAEAADAAVKAATCARAAITAAKEAAADAAVAEADGRTAVGDASHAAGVERRAATVVASLEAEGNTGGVVYEHAVASTKTAGDDFDAAADTARSAAAVAVAKADAVRSAADTARKAVAEAKAAADDARRAAEALNENANLDAAERNGAQTDVERACVSADDAAAAFAAADLDAVVDAAVTDAARASGSSVAAAKLAPVRLEVSAVHFQKCLEVAVAQEFAFQWVFVYFVFLVFFATSMGFMYMSWTDDTYMMNTALRKNLMEDEMFKEIDTHDDFYAWLQSTAKNFWVTKDEYDRAVAVRGNASSLSLTRTQLVGINRVQAGNGLFAERQNYPLHFMMLRQKRVEMQPCGSRSQDQAGALHPEVWRRIENTCIDKLSRSDREADPLRNVSRSFPHVNDSTRSVPYPDITTDPFVTDGKKEPQLPPMRSSWSSFLGRTYYHYSGDKKLYSAKLPYQELFLGDVEKIVSDLKANDWIDFTTRVVVVEAIVYNAVRHQYVLLHYVVEFTHSGHVTSFSTSDPFWLLFRNSGGWHSFVFACDIILVFFVVLGFGEWVWKARLSWMMGKHPIKVLGDDWKYLQVLQLGFTIACLVFRFRLWARSESLSLSTAEWENVVRGDSDVYADLLSYQAVFEMAKGWSALSFLLALGRFYEYIRYSGLLRSRLTETLSLAARNLFRILLFTFLVSLAFGLVANVIYGSHMREFRTIQVSFERLLRMLNEGGFDTYDEMRELDPLWTPFFFLVYLITAWLILLNVVLAVLAAGFSAAQSPKTGYSGVREAVTHVVKRRKRPMSDYALCCRLLRHHVSRKRNKYYDANEKQLGNVFDDRTVKVVLGEVLKLTTELPRCCGVFSCASPVQNKGTDKAVETYQWDRFVSPSDTISMMRDAIAQGPKKLS
eukprot:Rhum_TRINITY_DN15056_c4_g1::Rhum_TRINITY_DN15056_c4_g1_i6::g.135338::m.135338